MCWVIFRGQKYVKKGYMEMRKWIFLVPLKSVLGRSILHYWVLFLFSFEVFALLGLLSLTAFWVSVDKILLASSTLLEFSDNNSKLFEVEIGLVNDVLIFDANFLGIMKGSVWIFVFLSKLPVFTVFWITFDFLVKFGWCSFWFYISLEDKLFRLGVYLIRIVMNRLRMFLSQFFLSLIVAQ